jgi:O-antigen/teichoic acid export membrane protein
VLIKPFYALSVDIPMQLALGNARYGQLFALWNLAFLMSIFADLGILQHSSSAVSKNNDYFYQHFSNIAFTKAILAILYTISAICIGFFLNYKGQELYFLSLLIINQILVSFISFGRANIAGFGYYKIDSLLSALDKFLMLLTGWALLKGYAGLTISEETFIFSQMFAFFATFLVVLGINISLYLKNKIAKIANFDFWKLLKICFPYALVVLLMGLYSRLDTILLERWSQDPNEAGYYSFAFRILDIANMVGVLFGGLLLNMFSKLLSDKTALRRLFWVSFFILVSGYMLGAVLTYLFGEWISIFLLGFYDTKAIFTLNLLFIALIFAGIIHIAGTLLTAVADLKRMNSLFAVAIIINIFLNYFFIPKYGAIGAATVAIVTQMIVAVVEMRWAWQRLKL